MTQAEIDWACAMLRRATEQKVVRAWKRIMANHWIVNTNDGRTTVRGDRWAMEYSAMLEDSGLAPLYTEHARPS